MTYRGDRLSVYDFTWGFEEDFRCIGGGGGGAGVRKCFALKGATSDYVPGKRLMRLAV